MQPPSSIAVLPPLPPSPLSRTSSPAPPRSASKCQALLRDTLRRAEGRRSLPAQPLPLRYGAHDGLIAHALVACDGDDEDDDDACFFTSAPLASTSTSTSTGLRRSSTTTGHRRPPRPSTPSPPSPATSLNFPPLPEHHGRRHLGGRSASLSGYGHGHGHRPSHSLSSIPGPAQAPPPPPSSPVVPFLRTPTPLRASASAFVDVDHDHELRPHERALRTRLQGVLAAQPHPYRGRAVTSPQHPHSDWPWSSPETSPESEAAPSLSEPSSESLLAPSPPTTPPPQFDARTASELCRAAPGYVSFRDVEGLGAPPDEPEDGEDHGKGGPGAHWWSGLGSWSPWRRERRASMGAGRRP